MMNVLRVTGKPPSNHTLREQIEAYLPSNYWVEAVLDDDTVLVLGEDVAGWTADDYVIPRLASGLYVAKHVTGPRMTEDEAMAFFDSRHEDKVRRGIEGAR